MKIVKVLIPSVPLIYDSVVAFYRDLLELPVSRDFYNEELALHFTLMEPILLLRANDRDALRISEQVQAILIVDDILAYWERVSAKAKIIVPLEEIPTGKRFIVEHPDQKTFEYLQLAS